MCATDSKAELRELFRQTLNAAIAQGRVPHRDTKLGYYTLVAIRVVAEEHPDATADLIASAYDAFLGEHE